jgi:hypothetical protein
MVIAMLAMVVGCRDSVADRRALERAPSERAAGRTTTRVLNGAVTAHALSPYLTVGLSPADACRRAVAAGAPAARLPGGLLAIDRATPRRPVVMLNAWEHSAIATIKAANPRAKVIVYKDMSSTRDYRGAVDGGRDAALLPTGVGYVEAATYHPDWFLTGPGGRRFTYAGYPGHWQMDVGNATYQQAWLANVAAEVRANGWDGVFVDNALGLIDSYHPGVKPAGYPNDGAWHAAYRSMLSGIGARMHEGGFIAVANISDAYRFPGLWQDWISLIDGATQEHFANWNTTAGTGYLYDWGADSAWRGHVDELAAAGRVGRSGWAVVKGAPGDGDLLRYGYASYLLAADERSWVTLGEPATWIPELDWELGAPTGAARADGTTYRRDFAGGTVVVNASNTARVTVALGRALVDATGASRDSVTLPPLRAAVLRIPGGPPVAAAADPLPEVVVTDDAGRTLATAPLADVTRQGDTCTVRFSASLPDRDDYRVAVPGRPAQRLTAADLERRAWQLAFG